MMQNVGLLSDEELLIEAHRLTAAEDHDSLYDPASMLSRVMPGYVRLPHIDVISMSMRKIMDGEIDRLLIMEPPRTGKTLTAVIGGAVWWLGNRPSDRVIIGSYGSALAVERGRDSRKLVVEHGHRFGLELSRGSSAVQDWRLNTGGGVLSVGVGTGVAGRPGDLAIIDDPHKSRAEASSRVARERVYRWLSADIVSRLAPGAPLVIVMTPWHPSDLAARVVEDEGTTADGGRWEVIRMPAICDREDDPLRRKIGEPLQHPKIPAWDTAAALAHWHDKRRSSTVQDWLSLYQCDPRPSNGSLLPRELLRDRRCHGFPEGVTAVRTAVAVDPSGGGRDTAGIIGGHLGSDRRLYIERDDSGVMAPDMWGKRACKLAVDIGADLIVFEKNFGGTMAGMIIRTAWAALMEEERETIRERLVREHHELLASDIDHLIDDQPRRYARLCPRIRDVTARQSKRLRADPITQQWIEDRIRMSRYLPELEDEWATWEEGLASPGRIDASVYLAYALLPTPRRGGSSAAPSSGFFPTTTSSPLA